MVKQFFSKLSSHLVLARAETEQNLKERMPF